MSVEAAEKNQPTPPPASAERTMAHEAQSTWAPGTNNLKLGAICNDAYSQSLATQYNNLDQYALKGIGNGIGQMLAVGEFGFQLVTDAASVVTADMQIGYEKLTYPALAEANSDVLAQHMRQLGAKYEPALQPLKQANDAMGKDLNDIGAQSITANNAYARLLTDPASNIANAVDKFTGQTPGEQVKAITGEATQLAAFGLAEKALAGVLSTAQIAAKYDQLLAKMDNSLNSLKTADSQLLKGQVTEYAGAPNDYFNAIKPTTDKGENFNAMSKPGDLSGDAGSEKIPAPKSLSNIEARDWYNAKVAKIDSVEQQMRAEGKSLKEIHETTTNLRNEAKQETRDLMKDRNAAKRLEKESPLHTPEEILAKYDGDYEKAIAASKRTNQAVNERIERERMERDKQ